MSGKKNIFIIDDSTTNVVLLEAVLESKGYNTSTALSVSEAFPKIVKEMPDLILLDLLMPDISGFEFLKQLRDNQDIKDIPVVVVSALTDDVNIKKTKDLGAKEFLKKPLDIPALLQITEKILK